MNDELIRNVKEFYESMSDEELKQKLIDAGFEIIENGNGKIIFTDDID